MTCIVVFGAGGHGKVVADVALRTGLHVRGFVDDSWDAGTPILVSERDTVRVIGSSRWLAQQPKLALALGIGDNATRQRIAEECAQMGHCLATLVHPTAVISRFAVVGAATVIMANAVVNPGARVGEGCIVNTGAVIEHDAELGDFGHVSPNSTLAGAAKVGPLTHIGAGATVIPQVSVGARAVVGAGAVVIQSVGDDVVVAGVPARILRRLDW